MTIQSRNYYYAHITEEEAGSEKLNDLPKAMYLLSGIRDSTLFYLTQNLCILLLTKYHWELQEIPEQLQIISINIKIIIF